MMMGAELMADVVLYAIYVVLFAAAGAVLWSLGWRFAKNYTAPQRHVLLVVALLAVSLCLTWLLASTSPLHVGGQLYTDVFWLRAADMFINTSILLIAVCSVIIAVAKFRR